MAKPYKKRNNNIRRRRRKKYAKKSKTYTVSVAKLASKKIDSLLERRMVEISQASRIKLISRRYFSTKNDPNTQFGPYNQVFGIGTNGDVLSRSNNWNRTRYQVVGTDPLCYTLTAISAQDVNQPLNQMINPADQDGVAQGMTTQDQHGRRRGKFINVTGISLDLRIIHDWGILEQDPALIGTKEMLRSFLKNSGGKATVYWKIISVPVEPPGTLPVQTELDKQAPAIASVASEIQEWGYSTALDYKKIDSQNNNNDPTVVSRKRRYKVLNQGKINLDIRPKTTFDCRINTSQTIQLPYQTLSIKEQKIERSYYVPFPDPIKIEYAPRDQDGILTVNQTIYLVICSNVDISQAEGPLEQKVAPRISMVTKLYYFEP